MKRIFAAIAIATMMAPMTAAQAGTVIDQSNQQYSSGFSYIDSNVTAQTFIAGFNNSNGAGLFAAPGYGQSSPSTIDISLWSGRVGDLDSVKLAEGSATATEGTWADASWNAVALVVGGLYNVQFTGPVANAFVSGYGPSYLGGTAFYNGLEYASFDLTFRTFADDQFTPAGAGAVPEPSSWALMIGGFGLVGASMRRRNAAALNAA